MNKHIELVKKWLADKDSVSQTELMANYYEAVDAAGAAWAAWVAEAAEAAIAPEVAWAAEAAANAVARAADSAFDADAAEGAAYWVKEYEEMTDE